MKLSKVFGTAAIGAVVAVVKRTAGQGSKPLGPAIFFFFSLSCTAEDLAGNSAEESFTVTVERYYIA
jgi:hypothetical protein